MRVVDALHDRQAKVQAIGVPHVVHEQQEIVRERRNRFVGGGKRSKVLANIAGAGADRSIHSHSVFVCAYPVSPPVTQSCDTKRRQRAALEHEPPGSPHRIVCGPTSTAQRCLRGPP